jgi:actin related protein 2/3 complex subunit 2
MQQQYGQYITNTETGYDITLQIDLAKPPQDKARFAHNIALLKRHALAAPFYKVFNDIEQKKGAGPVVELRYRDEEAFFLKPESDRLIVIFSIQFKDADDVVFAKVFLQEFQDARRTMSNAPSVTYSQKEPPLELQGVKNLRVGSNNGYVSFGKCFREPFTTQHVSPSVHSSHIILHKRHFSCNNVLFFFSVVCSSHHWQQEREDH